MFALPILLAPLLALIPSPVSAHPVPSAAPPTYPWHLPAGWTPAPVKCIAEPGISGRALAGPSFKSYNMKVETCLAFCDSKNMPLAGLEFGNECYCGAVLSNGASLTPSENCYFPCAGDGGRLCGGPDGITLYVSTGPSADRLSDDFTKTLLTLPPGWSDEGCVADQSGMRVLDAEKDKGEMSVEKCLGFCAAFGFPLAGVSSGDTCFCDTQRRADYGSSNQCTKACTGDPGVPCGGHSAIQIYHNPSLSPYDSSSNSYTFQNCITEVPGRALTSSQLNSDLMTVDVCTSYCAQNGYKYAGLQFGRECACGNELSNGASVARTSDQCTMPCKGDRGSNCGGRQAIALYLVE